MEEGIELIDEKERKVIERSEAPGIEQKQSRSSCGNNVKEIFQKVEEKDKDSSPPASAQKQHTAICSDATSYS